MVALWWKEIALVFNYYDNIAAYYRGQHFRREARAADCVYAPLVTPNCTLFV